MDVGIVGPTMLKPQVPLCELFYLCVLRFKGENIGNHGYIDTSILRIYWIYQRYIGGYFGKKYWQA